MRYNDLAAEDDAEQYFSSFTYRQGWYCVSQEPAAKGTLLPRERTASKRHNKGYSRSAPAADNSSLPSGFGSPAVFLGMFRRDPTRFLP
jgi:hypothetical protein